MIVCPPTQSVPIAGLEIHRRSKSRRVSDR